jgi:hypothetical protein
MALSHSIAESRSDSDIDHIIDDSTTCIGDRQVRKSEDTTHCPTDS